MPHPERNGDLSRGEGGELSRSPFRGGPLWERVETSETRRKFYAKRMNTRGAITSMGRKQVFQSEHKYAYGSRLDKVSKRQIKGWSRKEWGVVSAKKD